MDDLDRELERRGHRFARYADDILIVAKTVRAVGRIMSTEQGSLSVRDLWPEVQGYA